MKIFWSQEIQQMLKAGFTQAEIDSYVKENSILVLNENITVGIVSALILAILVFAIKKNLYLLNSKEKRKCFLLFPSGVVIALISWLCSPITVFIRPSHWFITGESLWGFLLPFWCGVILAIFGLILSFCHDKTIGNITKWINKGK